MQKHNLDNLRQLDDNFCPEFAEACAGLPNAVRTKIQQILADEDTASRWHNSIAEKANVRQAIRTIVDSLNKGNEAEVFYGIATELSRTHRTLQQQFMRVGVGSILAWFALCDKEDFSDLRNEESVKLGAKLHKILDETPLPFI